MNDPWGHPTPEPTVNVPLLRKAVEWVEEQVELDGWGQWDQANWVMPESERIDLYDREPGCGTAYCVAGYVGQLVNPAYAGDAWGGADVGAPGARHVSDVAREALGLTPMQSNTLFESANGVDRIRALAEDFAGGAL
jgi:hypothetical protein